ncbi:V-type ATP synthase subunit I [Acidianus sp. RZ1]|uniref:V-type ATP synthase subunit I n=1 Tax=Acidianus sp. RZ1 TaxID=1540082 RepID=UPI0014911386
MIFPENMVKAEIFFQKEKIDDIVTSILKFGKLEPIEGNSSIQGRMEEARKELGTVQEHVNKIKIIMDIGKVIIEPKGKLTISGTWIDMAKKVNEKATELEGKYRFLLEEIGRIRSEIEILRAQEKEILPFKEITVDLSSLYSLELFDVLLGTVNETKIDKLRQEIAVVISSKIDQNKYAVMLIDKKGKINKEKIQREYGVRILELPENNSPHEIYVDIEKRISELQDILERSRTKLAKSLQESQNEIKEVYGQLLTIRDALTVMSKAKLSDYYGEIQGYVPEKDIKNLKGLLGDKAFLSYRRPKYGEKEEPPTYIKLPKRMKSIESIIELYGSPSYWEISPMIFLVFTFPFLFGLMFPDFGNALVLLIFAIWFFKYGKKKGSLNTINLSLVLIYSSIAAMITGLLAREFFGPLLVGGPREILNSNAYPVGPLYYVWPVPVSVSNALKYILPFGHYTVLSTEIENAMILSILLGAILLFASSLIGVIDAVKKKDREFIYFEKLPLVILYTVPLIIFGYGITNFSNYFGQVENLLGAILYNLFHSFSPNLSTPTYALAYILLLWVEIGLIYNWGAKTLLAKRHGGVSLGGAVGIGFVEGGFEAGILLLSNTISFIRVLVFALSHYYILYAFSYMGLLVFSYKGLPFAVDAIIGGIIVVLGNLLAIALEGLIVFIQDMRLHFYEMFSKFYEGRGKKFEPVAAYVVLEEGAEKQKLEVPVVLSQ